MNQWTVTADDYGLTRSVTDTILEAVDAGGVNRVSVLANGLAFEYAMQEAVSRPNLELSVHINLTEGRPVSPVSAIPLLVHSDGFFANTPTRLLLRTLFATRRTRENIIAQIEREVSAQINKLRGYTPGREVSIDGHQHVHMVPAIFQILVRLHRENPFRTVRMPQEPFFLVKDGLGFGLIRHFGLNILARYNRRFAASVGLKFPDMFVGSLMSGRLTQSNVSVALQGAVHSGALSVEIAIHPGEAAAKAELEQWSGDIEWYLSPWRERERRLVCSGEMQDLQAKWDSYIAALSVGHGKGKITRFVISGIISTATTLGLLYAFTEWMHLWYVFSVVIAYVISIAVSFLLQKIWTFNNHDISKIGAQAVRYIVLNAGNIVLNAAGLYLLVELTHIWYVAGEIIVAGAIAVWSYVVMRYLIFKPHFSH